MNAAQCMSRWLVCGMVAVGAAAVLSPAMAQIIVPVAVPGWSDPWLAGMPDGSTASCWEPEGCDIAPDQSPQLVEGLCLDPGTSLTFEATGLVAHWTGTPCDPPDGDGVTNHNWGSMAGENGISDIYAPYDCLLGVFLDDEQPDLTPEPPYLDFTTPESRDYLALSPELKQTFFIGDGRTSTGATQHVVIPAGATRLFLGTMDSSTWWNNVGQFDVLVTDGCTPSAAHEITLGSLRTLYR